MAWPHGDPIDSDLAELVEHGARMISMSTRRAGHEQHEIVREDRTHHLRSQQLRVVRHPRVERCSRTICSRLGNQHRPIRINHVVWFESLT